MKKFYCSSENELLEKLGEEGKDWEYIDFVEGCLQDNFIIGTDNATIFVFEHYLNCWSSDLEVYVLGVNEKQGKYWDRFESLRKEEEEQQ